MPASLTQGAEKEAPVKPQPERVVGPCVSYLGTDKTHKHTPLCARIKPTGKT